MSISAKWFQKFRNLRSDAAPRPPRVEQVVSNIDNEESFDNHYDTNGYQDDKDDKDYKEKPKFFDTNKKNKPEKSKREKSPPPSSPVNTQATGNVINIVNSNNIHWGPEITYNMSTSPFVNEQDHLQKEEIKKTAAISTLLAAQIKPEHVYMDYVSKNLGKRWKSFFRGLGYTQGAIETAEETEAQYGVSEVRYKLLLDWKQNDDVGTLGALATALWKHDEKCVVRELADIYAQRST